MSLTIDQIKLRKQQLEDQREQLIGNINAIAGAIQDCDYWIQLLEQEEQVASTPAGEKDVN